MLSNKATLLYITGFTVLPIILKYYFDSVRKKRKEALKIKTNTNDFYYHCLFPQVNEPCRRHIWDKMECGDQCGYIHITALVNFLSSAKESISFCMYHLTLLEITDELLKAKKRGVNVRMITDPTTYDMDHSKVRLLKERHRFPVRMPTGITTYMHHKFCLIDEKNPDLAKMFFGSLNLTLQGLVTNFEYVLLTNDTDIMSRYSEEFELLWDGMEK